MRIDESLYFANAAYLEDTVFAQAALREDLAHVILMCPAVNAIDLSALEALEESIHALKRTTSHCASAR